MKNNRSNKPYGHRLRGVDAFMSDAFSSKELSSPVTGQELTIEQIQLPSQQPRRYFDSAKLNELVSSIRQHGILEPLLVRPLANGKYELVAGERRFRAAKQLNLPTIPVIIRILSESEALQLALIENLQREDLNPIEETEGILQLIALRLGCSSEAVSSLLYKLQNWVAGKVTDNVISNEEKEAVETVFKGLGRMNWESFTANRLPLLRLPDEVLLALRQGQIEYTKAKAIARVKNSELRSTLLTEAISKSLSLSEIKERIRAIQTPLPRNLGGKQLKSRFTSITQQLKKSSLWENPDKKAQLETLLSQMETLLEEES